MKPVPRQIIDFWLNDVGPARWYKMDPKLDAEIARRFKPSWQDARDGKLKAWEANVESALALLLLLDQFPRNMFRGKREAFSTDAMARAVAERTLNRGYDLLAPAALRAFFYLPFMHSERMADQHRSVELIAGRLGTAAMNYPFALSHRDEIARFGRFPHRNKALGRRSTAAERDFLVKSTPR